MDSQDIVSSLAVLYTLISVLILCMAVALAFVEEDGQQESEPDAWVLDGEVWVMYVPEALELVNQS